MLIPLLLVLAAADGGTEPLAVMGSLDKKIIQGVIKEGRPAITACDTKAAAGTVKVKFVISKTGAVSSAEVASDTTGDADLAGCVTKAVHGLTFPAPKGGGIVIVTFPFVFPRK